MYTDIALAEFELTGRGVICTRDLKCDEIVFTLPEHLIISADQALKCPKLGNLFTELKSQQLLDDEGALMLYFINETFHNPNSIWRPYLDILPTKVTSSMTLCVTSPLTRPLYRKSFLWHFISTTMN
jgi:hypothetical protein